MIDWNSISGTRSAKPSFVSLPSFPENIIFQTWFLIYVPLLYPLTPSQIFFSRKRILSVGNEGSTSHWLWCFFSKSLLSSFFYPLRVLQINFLSFLVYNEPGFVSPQENSIQTFLGQSTKESASWYIRKILIQTVPQVSIQHNKLQDL